MANNIVLPTLLVYTPITGTNTFVDDISSYVTGYTHTTRRIGGYWSASWKMYRETMADSWWNEWRTNRFFYHLVEQVNGLTSWEGAIQLIQPDDEKGLLDITAYGYVHTIQDRYSSTTDTGTTDADVWIETIRTTDCPYIASSALTANTLQCYKAGNERCWDEMLKIVELGDGSGTLTAAPYQLGVYQDRRLIYAPTSTTPVGYVRNGLKWRIDGLGDVRNYVIVRYTDETGAAQADIPHQNTESVALYGRREERLERSNLPTTSADALCYAYLNLHAYPQPRAVGCSKDIQIYDSIGCNSEINQWMVQPGVFVDTTQESPSQYLSYWLPDSSYFLVDEIVANEKGVQLRTSSWDELDALEAYYDYIADAPDEPKRKRKKKKK